MIKILDCTLRDGGYINNWRFNDTFKEKICRNFDSVNIDYVEIGFINKTDNYKNKIVGNSRILNKENIKYFDNSFSKGSYG